MNTASIALIFVGLFLAGGVYSFWKQKLPKSLLGVLAVGSAMCLVSGALRI